MRRLIHLISRNEVAPHAGAWIEITIHVVREVPPIVAPHAGAWIEMLWKHWEQFNGQRRSPCGSVD